MYLICSSLNLSMGIEKLMDPKVHHFPSFFKDSSLLLILNSEQTTSPFIKIFMRCQVPLKIWVFYLKKWRPFNIWLGGYRGTLSHVVDPHHRPSFQYDSEPLEIHLSETCGRACTMLSLVAPGCCVSWKSRDFQMSHEKKKQRPYFPLNPGCLIGILISWFITITI